MVRLDFKICAYDKNFSSIWTYTTMMLLRVRNHHGENVYIQDLVEFDVTRSKAFLPQVHHEFLLWEGCNRDAKSRMGCDGEIDDMLRIRLREARSDEAVFTLVAWIRAFNINGPIYAELCHEFYSTYEFDKVCADDELQTKKIIKFRLRGHAHSLTLLEFA
nr:hypothetical protein [Tanacetum cinerariifolium]